MWLWLGNIFVGVDFASNTFTFDCNHQSKVKEESLEGELSEISTNNLLDIEFKVMVIRMLKELSESYKKLYGSYRELSRNCISMKRT